MKNRCRLFRRRQRTRTVSRRSGSCSSGPDDSRRTTRSKRVAIGSGSRHCRKPSSRSLIGADRIPRVGLLGTAVVQCETGDIKVDARQRRGISMSIVFLVEGQQWKPPAPSQHPCFGLHLVTFEYSSIDPSDLEFSTQRLQAADLVLWRVVRAFQNSLLRIVQRLVQRQPSGQSARIRRRPHATERVRVGTASILQ